MRSNGLLIYLLTIFVATGLYWLLSLTGYEPSSKLTILLVLISIGFLRLFSLGMRRLRGVLQQRKIRTPKKVFTKEEEISHEINHSY